MQPSTAPVDEAASPITREELQAAYAQPRPDGQPWTARTLAEAARNVLAQQGYQVVPVALDAVDGIR
jgi:hypothetical protein